MKTYNSLVIWVVCLSLLLATVMPYAFSLLKIIFMPRNVSMWYQLELYQWLLAGCGIYMLLRRFFFRNIEWVETFSHELTHTVVAMLTFRTVLLFQVNESGGMVTTAGRHRFTEVLTALSPYCLPVFTYVMLLIRPLIANGGLWVFDLLTGMTLCFHIVCFVKQTSPRQPDIRQYPLGFSYLYLFVAHVMNFCIILVSFFPGYHVFSSFWRMVCAVWSAVI